MTLDHLRYFLAAADYEHITRAAQASHISSSVISNAVKTLEDEMGVSLFERAGRRVVLTSRGHELREKAKTILGEIDALASGLKAGTPELKGHSRVAASHFLSGRLLTPAVVETQRRHPALSFDVTASDTRSIFSDVLSGKLEAGLCFLPIKHPEVQEEIVYKGQHRIVVRRKHPVAKANHRRLSDLSNYPATFHKISVAHDVDQYRSVMEKYEVRSQVQTTYDNADIGLQIVLRTDAWTVTPDVCAKAYEKELFILPNPRGWEFPVRISLIYRRQNSSMRVISELSKSLHTIEPALAFKPQ